MRVWLNRLFFIGILSAFLLSFSPLAQASVEKKTASLWGKTLSYELVTLANKNVPYDGRSFVASQGGASINRVVINTAFFEKEALQIWEDFQKKGGAIPERSPDLMTFLVRLQGLQEREISTKEREELVRALLELKDQLQKTSWHPLYQRVTQETKNSSEAKKAFVRAFKETRIRTIEWHELSHLVDGAGAVAPATEVKAFLAELVYGENPQDSFWQVVAGVVDEIKRGQSVDHSLAKLRDVLAASCQMPWFVAGERVCFLCTLSKTQVVELARLAYRGYASEAS